MIEKLVWGLIKIVVGAIVVLYVAEVLRIYANYDESHRSTLTRFRSIHFIERLLIGAGVFLIRIMVRVIRAAVDMLAETSADLGEWAVARCTSVHKSDSRFRRTSSSVVGVVRQVPQVRQVSDEN